MSRIKGGHRVHRWTFVFGGVAAAMLWGGVAEAQRPFGYGYSSYPSTSFRPGGYVQSHPHSYLNPVTGARYRPGVGVAKSSGIYRPVGRGYYQNPITGNIYSPSTGSYTTGKDLHFRPGRYHHAGGGTHYNPTTGATYLPGRAVIKPSGVYTPIGGGYYRNHVTGNVYNPATGAYKTPR